MKPYLALTDNSLAAMKTFAESNGDPIVMVNLMQVRPNALYEPPLVDHCSGYEALARYTMNLQRSDKPRGPGWSGLVKHCKCLLGQARKFGM